MTRGSWGWVHAVALALCVSSVAALFARAVPRARDAGARDQQARAEIAALSAELARLQSPEAERAGEISGVADAAERQAQGFAEWLLRRESPSGGDQDADAIAADLASRIGQSRESLKALFPSRDLPSAEQAFRFATARDLLQNAAAAGVRQIVFLIFPEEPSRERASDYGPTLPSRLVRLEYMASYEAHRALVLELLGRRDRGPFYAFDALALERAPAAQPTTAARPPEGPAEPLVRATLTLRRVLPVPRSGP